MAGTLSAVVSQFSLSSRYRSTVLASDEHTSKFDFPVQYMESTSDESGSETRLLLVTPYALSVWRNLLFWIVSLLTAGVVPLVLSWIPLACHKARFVKTKSVFSAVRFLVVGADSSKAVVCAYPLHVTASELRRGVPSCSEHKGHEQKHTASHTPECVIKTIYFEYKCTRYVYNVWSHRFEPLAFDVTVPCTALHSLYGQGLQNETVRSERQQLYGRACVDVPVQPLYALIAGEVFHPFYIFQLSAIALWLWDGYYQYASAVIVITIVSLLVEVVEVRRAQRRLQKMAKFVCDVNVLNTTPSLSRSLKDRGPRLVQMSSVSLVPGDVIQITQDMTLSCDVLLLQGSVLVNESMLTGESVPVAKRALPYVPGANGPLFNIDKHSSHVLFGGTEVVTIRHANDNVLREFGITENVPLALVLRTGFSTTQGHMMRSILYPPPNDRANFKKESYKFLAMLALLGCIGSALAAYFTFRSGLHKNVVFLRALDTIPNAVPPSLTAAMTVGCSIAVAKLRRFWKIHCVAPSRVNVAGQVNTLVFDKTGTLTEEGLELDGVAYSRLLRHWDGDDAIALATASTTPPLFASLTYDAAKLPSILRSAMASCHSVMVAKNDFSGEPMEVQMLRFVNFSISEDPLSLFPPSVENAAGISVAHSQLASTLDRALPCITEVYREAASLLSSTMTSGKTSVSSGLQNATVLRVVKQFEFTSNLQRMSVLVWDRKRRALFVFCKGSPEQIRDRCVAESLPADFTQTLRRYTESGRRVLAFGVKRVPLDSRWEKVCTSVCETAACREAVELYSREEAEENLVFAGLAVFNNALKDETRGTIEELRLAGCRCVMATGDNALTAAAVARDSSIIEPTSEMILLGDVVSGSLCVTSEPQSKYSNSVCALDTTQRRLVWTPVLYSPTVDTLTRVDESQTTGKVRSSVCPASQLVKVGSFAQKEHPSSNYSFLVDDDTPSSLTLSDSRCNDSVNTSTAASVVVTLQDLSKQSRPPDLASGYYTSSEIQEYLNGKDPRDVVLVLTGPAFRFLKEQQETLNIPWSTEASSLPEQVCLRCVAPKNLMSASPVPNKSFFPPLASWFSRSTPQATAAKNASWSSNLSTRRHSREAFLSDVESCNSAAITYGTAVMPPLGKLFQPWVPQPGVAATFRITVYSDCSAEEQQSRRCSCMIKPCDVGGSRVTEKQRETRAAESTLHQLAAQLSVVQRDSVACNTSVPLPCRVSHVEISLFEFCLRYCRVYARMSPDDKAALVTSLRSLPASPLVGMCGDGVNDCPALRAADLGLSLSDKEASIAAPFTSARKSIKSCVDLLRESRGALVNSFQSFKFIALYAMLQLATSVTLYAFGNNLTDPQYLWVDLLVVLPLSMTMAWTHASSKLAPRLPLRRLAGLPVILSLGGQILIQLAFIIAAVTLLRCTSFYKPYLVDPNKEYFEPEALRSYENTVVFLVSAFQYITTCTVLAIGKPWRKRIFTNLMFMILLVTVSSISVLLLLAPEYISPIASWLTVVRLPSWFRWTLVGLITLNCVVTYTFERYAIRGWATRREEAKDRATHIIDSTLPLDKTVCVRFDHKNF